MNRLRGGSLQFKISAIYIVTNLFMLCVNLALLAGINGMSSQLDTVYQDNLHLNELSEALTQTQDNMTAYLSAKTTDSLENYYRSEQAFSEMVRELDDQVTGSAFERMERNIRHMSECYLETAGQTIEAKRGRNVEKYRVRYESTTQMYDYIIAYISALNSEQFKNNSTQYMELLRRFRLFEMVSMIVMTAVMVGNVGIIISFTGTVIKPLKRLAGSADEIAKGNFDIELQEPESTDEVGIVTHAFNSMVVSIGKYIEQIRDNMEAERKLKEKELLMEAHLKDARLKYLQAQINPHFLFNTLNAGAQLAMMEGADRTYEYVQKVAQFYRYNMKKSEENVSLAEEIEMVDSYIYILNVRFAGDIHYEKNVDEALMQTQMPGMILQPIVENCVNHGIREMDGEGMIRLCVYRESGAAGEKAANGDFVGGGGPLCISIKDNGVGMSRETIDRVMNGTYRTSSMAAGSNGIGMDNVISRMRLYTGDEDAVEINSKGKGQGTEVLIRIRQAAGAAADRGPDGQSGTEGQ